MSKEKLIVVYEVIGDTYNVYDGKSKKETTKEGIKTLSETKKAICLTRKRGEIKTLEHFYQYIIQCATELKKESKGKINMYITGSFSSTARCLWKMLGTYKNKVVETEPLTKLETDIIKNYKGALIFSEKNYNGVGYKYDFVSSYPSIMQDYKFLVPIKQPKELILKKLTDATYRNPTTEKLHYKYGFYHIKIEKANNELIDRQFKYQPDDWYTSIDIEHAIKLRLKGKMIQDNKPNLLHYSRKECETGQVLFCNFINILFELKKNKVAGAKEILNSLSGLLMQKQTMLSDTIVENKNETKIYQTDDKIVFQYEKEEVYKSHYARIKPFLYAQGRTNLINIIHKHNTDIVQAHTDGFISKKKLDVQTGDELGKLKYEGYLENIEVINSNNIKGLKGEDGTNNLKK